LATDCDINLRQKKESVVDIVNAMLELLIKERSELPAFSTLERMAVTARSKTNDNYFNAIADSLPASAKSELEQLVYTLRDISNSVSSGGANNEQHKTKDSLMGNAPEKVAIRCDRLVSFGLTNPLQFLSKRYTRPLRKALFDCLVHLDIDTPPMMDNCWLV
jgi:hypothetical protein